MDINLNSKVIREHLGKQIDKAEARMNELRDELDAVAQEHSFLVTMALAYDNGEDKASKAESFGASAEPKGGNW